MLLEFLRAIDKTGFAVPILTVIAVVLTYGGFGLYRLWFWYGPGCLERRKNERRNLWFKVRYEASPEAPDLPYRNIGISTGTVPRKPAFTVPDWLSFMKPKASQGIDREAFEREVRRWD